MCASVCVCVCVCVCVQDADEYDDSSKSKTPTTTKPGGDTINVFTVASGHMYERLQKIMILSVLNHTKSRVKFWFISNYMSPHHKQVRTC